MHGTIRIAALAVLGAFACQGPAAQPLYPAGTDKDEGHGELARASARLMTSDERTPDGFASSAPAHHRLGTDADGGDVYGGGTYGGASYGYQPAQWTSPPTSHAPHYTPTHGLTGAIEGVVSWTGAAPPRLSTACGVIANPSIRVSSDHTVGGVLVYIEKVSVGRPLPVYNRPVGVGGLLSKHGCALAPALQIVTPLPAPLAIHGDGVGATIRVAMPASERPYELERGGRVQVQLQPGVTRVDADNLAAAWVLALDTPYYALTDDNGRFRIDELAPGSYDVTFWQAPVARIANGKLAYGAPVIVHRAIKVDAVHPGRLDVTLGR